MVVEGTDPVAQGLDLLGKGLENEQVLVVAKPPKQAGAKAGKLQTTKWTTTTAKVFPAKPLDKRRMNASAISASKLRTQNGSSMMRARLPQQLLRRRVSLDKAEMAHCPTLSCWWSSAGAGSFDAAAVPPRTTEETRGAYSLCRSSPSQHSGTGHVT